VDPITLTMVGKPGCHLCDDAKVAILDVLVEFPEIVFEEVSLEDNPLWVDIYGERIPVVLIDGVEHAQWRVDPESLRQALADAQAKAESSQPTTGSLFIF
jgi:glutaredoxin